MLCRALIVVGLLLALCAVAQADPAPARERVLPVGTVTTHVFPPPRPDCRACTGTTVTEQVAGEDQLQVNVSTGRKGNEARRLAAKLEQDLKACSRNAAIVKAQPSRWWTAAKWTAVGVAVGGSFALGVMAGR